jgi:hypothetical protein
MRDIEKPVTKANTSSVSETVTTHPAFGQIQANRVSGHAQLYASDFLHHNTIRIEIKRSELHRSLSRDWHFARETIAEVEMSEAQWATFISTLNVGGGTPCTLLATETNRSLPGLPRPEKRQDQFAEEMKKTLNKTRKQLSDLHAMIERCSLSAKAKREMLMALEVAGYGVGSSIEFVANQFGEHMEKVTEDAKIEVEAYVNNVVSRTGLAVLKGEKPPIELPAPKGGNA